jgi:energy-coupling factor transporter ATP-binding protein EcfA2
LDRPLLLRAAGLERRLGDRRLWSRLDLELAGGDRLGLVAPSGAGKTLLLRTLALLDPPQAGRFSLLGRPPAAWGLPRWRAMVAYLFSQAMAGDMQAAGVLMNRLVPPLRPKDEPVSVGLPDGGPLEQARAIVAAVAGGTLTPQDGTALLDGLAALVKIQEVTEVIPRIEALEGQR